MNINRANCRINNIIYFGTGHFGCLHQRCAEMPYSVAQNNEELEENILNFDEKDYEEKLKRFEKAVELVFDGKASERACEYLEKSSAR